MKTTEKDEVRAMAINMVVLCARELAERKKNEVRLSLSGKIVLWMLFLLLLLLLLNLKIQIF